MVLTPKTHMLFLMVVFPLARCCVQVSCSLPSHMTIHKAHNCTDSPEEKFGFCHIQLAVSR